MVDIPEPEAPPRAAAGLAFDPFDVDESMEPTGTRVVMRGEIEVEETERIENENPNLRIYSDPEIEVCPICPGSLPLGNTATVASLLGRAQLQQSGMTGRGVLLATVDTGLNLEAMQPFDVSAVSKQEIDAYEQEMAANAKAYLAAPPEEAAAATATA